MQIRSTSLLVADQEKALQFYASKLGFTKCQDVMRGAFRWLSLTSPEGAHGVELILEPLKFPPARAYQEALYQAGLPAATFTSVNIDLEVERLKRSGVEFQAEPLDMGLVTTAVFDDTCGNLIRLVQLNGRTSGCHPLGLEGAD